MKTKLTKDDPAGWYECDFSLRSGKRAVYWDGGNAIWGRFNCNGAYTNFRRLYTEEDAAAMGQRWEELFTANQTLQFQVSTLTSDLEKLKAHPYTMRKAERPDCVGLWLNTGGCVLNITDLEAWNNGPYYYLGPLPVIPKEQLPPKVVRIRDVVTGETCLAIPSFCGSSYCRIAHDGTFVGVAGMGWEVIQ